MRRTISLKLKFIKLLLFVFFLSFNAYSQFSGDENSEPYKVGDNITDLSIHHLINYPKDSAKVSDFKGKILILDFWSTHCVSCITSWPKLLALQSRFKDKLQIVLINPVEKEDKIRDLFKAREPVMGSEMDLPNSCYDRSLLKLFHVSGVPHIVWVNEEGTIFSVTEAGSVNVNNITALLEHKKVNMPQKMGLDEYVTFESTKPIFLNGNGGDLETEGAIMDYSILTKGRERIWHALAVQSSRTYGYYYAVGTESSILDLYRLAYSTEVRVTNPTSILPLLPNRIELKVKDPKRFLRDFDGEIQSDNIYNYEYMSNQPKSLAELQRRMQSDLKNNFHLNATWQKKVVKAMVLRATDTMRFVHKRADTSERMDDFMCDLNNVPIKFFIQCLEDRTAKWHNSPYPIVDATGFKGLLGNFKFRAEMEDVNLLNEALKKYGLYFKLEDRPIDILVLREEP